MTESSNIIMDKKTLMPIHEFSKAHSLFIEAITSKSIPNARLELKFMKQLDEDLARESCLKALCIISEDIDYLQIVTDIIESKLFECPHHQRLESVTPILLSNVARVCTSTKYLYQTLTHLASQMRLSVIKVLNVLDEDGYSALHLSVMNGDFKATKCLIEIGSDCNNKSKSGNSAISLAVAYGHDCLVPLLLNRSDVNTQDLDHDTPLMFAVWNNAPKITSALIQHGADVNKKNKHGSSAIWNAVYQSAAECVFILLCNNSTMDVSCEGTDLFFNEEDYDYDEKVTKLYPGCKRSLLWVAVDRIGFSFSEHGLKVLLILLEAGYDVTKEHWLRNCSRAPADCQNNLLNNPALLDMLQFQYKHPQNLKDLCRNSLRKRHRLSNMPFHKWVLNLSLPQNLKGFLTLSYIM